MNIKPEHIPPEVARAVHDLFEPGYLESIGLRPESIAAAALSAWPGMMRKQTDEHLALFNSDPAIILPLPQTRKSGTYDDEFGKLWA